MSTSALVGQSETPTWPRILTALIAREDLSTEQAAWAMNQIMLGEATASQVAGFLMALRSKGESVDEMTGLANQMLAHANLIEVPGATLDIVGTGGDRSHTVNISTMSAIVAAAAGRTIVKHGNRAASSKSGAADVLEALGINLSLPPTQVAEIAAECGITFCFAQNHHPSMRHVAVPRRELGVGTAFNFLGPLTNPGRATMSAVGCADPRMAPLMAGVFAARGTNAAVFRGDDGLDEVTVTTTTSVWWVRDGQVQQFTLDPQALGLSYAPIEALRGGEAAENAQVVRDLVAGQRGPVRDAVVLNTGVALAIADPAPVTTQEEFHAAVRRGMDAAQAALDSGAAAEKVSAWMAASAAR